MTKTFAIQFRDETALAYQLSLMALSLAHYAVKGERPQIAVCHVSTPKPKTEANA